MSSAGKAEARAGSAESCVGVVSGWVVQAKSGADRSAGDFFDDRLFGGFDCLGSQAFAFDVWFWC